MRPDDARNKSREWLWISLVWLAFALFDATKTVGVMQAEGMHHNWPVLFLIEVLSWLPWAVGTALIFRIARRMPPRVRPNVAWLAHVAAGVVIGLVFAAWTTLLVLDFRPFGQPEPPGFLRHWVPNFFDGLPSTVVFYSCILMIHSVLDSRERAAVHKTEVAQLNERLAQAHLRALRHQVEPHFLFNSLNAVAGLVREGRQEDAVDMIASLGDFLRRSLAGSNRQEVALRDEVDFTRQYLSIQQTRFAGRLGFDIEIPGSLESARVPSLILQPIVENAIKHGIARQKDGGSVRIAASSADGMLTLSVTNDGPPVACGWDAGELGIGIANVRARLRGLYGDVSTFDMSNTGGGVEVSMSIPLRTSGRLGEPVS